MFSFFNAFLISAETPKIPNLPPANQFVITQPTKADCSFEADKNDWTLVDTREVIDLTQGIYYWSCIMRTKKPIQPAPQSKS
jgi:hypothetical protein